MNYIGKWLGNAAPMADESDAASLFIQARSKEILDDNDPRLEYLAFDDDPEGRKKAAERLATQEWERDISEPLASDLMAYEARLRGEE